MAYTIIEVSRQTGVSSHTLRFWAKKGCFPFVEKDKNGVKYFSKSDVEWVNWVVCLRQIGMSIEDIKTYINLAHKGIQTAKQRQAMLTKQQESLKKQIKQLQKIS